MTEQIYASLHELNSNETLVEMSFPGYQRVKISKEWADSSSKIAITFPTLDSWGPFYVTHLGLGFVGSSPSKFIEVNWKDKTNPDSDVVHKVLPLSGPGTQAIFTIDVEDLPKVPVE